MNHDVISKFFFSAFKYNSFCNSSIMHIILNYNNGRSTSNSPDVKIEKEQFTVVHSGHFKNILPGTFIHFHFVVLKRILKRCNQISKNVLLFCGNCHCLATCIIQSHSHSIMRA